MHVDVHVYYLYFNWRNFDLAFILITGTYTFVVFSRSQLEVL